VKAAVSMPGPQSRIAGRANFSGSGTLVPSRMYNYLDFEKPVADLEGKIMLEEDKTNEEED
jgi:hypothetical protein